MSDSDDLHTCASRELLESIAIFHFPALVPELLPPPSLGSHHTDQIRDVGLLLKNPFPSAVRRLLKLGPVSNVCPPFSLQTKTKFYHVALYI